MADFGKLNFAVAFNPQTAFPLDARYYFDSLTEAQAAAAEAVEVGSSDGVYFFGEEVCVVADNVATLYIIQPDKTLKAVGSEILGDDKSIEIVDGKVALKGFGSATAGQQPRINAAGNAIEWYTPDTSTVSGLSETVAGHTTDISNLQNGKADKATTLEGYGITDAMTAEEIASAIQTAIAGTEHASFKKADAIPTLETAEDNILYLVMNADTGFYDIYAKVENAVVRLDDVSVDLDNYVTIEQLNTALNNKVDKIEGKGLSTNDYTNEEKEKLASIVSGAEVNVINGASNEFSISEDDKILSVVAISQDKITGLADSLAGKVDAEEGKSLSANDFTNELKAKLEGLNADGEANVLNAIKINGTALTIEDKAVDIPIATKDVLGVVKGTEAENGIAISEAGEMSINSLNINKVTQTEGETLILDGGSSAD